MIFPCIIVDISNLKNFILNSDRKISEVLVFISMLDVITKPALPPPEKYQYSMNLLSTNAYRDLNDNNVNVYNNKSMLNRYKRLLLINYYYYYNVCLILELLCRYAAFFSPICCFIINILFSIFAS